MCTGYSPFRAESTIAAIRRVCDNTPRPIREINLDIPQWLVEIIDRLLAKRPDDRFQSAADLVGRHLAHLQDPRSTPIPGPLPQSPRNGLAPRRRRWLFAACALLVLFGGLDHSR